MCVPLSAYKDLSPIGEGGLSYHLSLSLFSRLI